MGQTLIAACTIAFPSANAALDEEGGRIKALMHAFVLEYAKMSPYIASDASFQSAKGQEVIKESLGALEKQIKKGQPKQIRQNPGFKITYRLLADHISRTKEIFERGEFTYARMRVNGIGNLCAGCHMQTPTPSTYSAFEFITGKNKDVTFENANFLFTIRHYDDALKMFDALIRKYPESKATTDQLNEIYTHKLGILARVERKPKMAIDNLSEDLKNLKLPVDVRANVKSWIESIKKWTDEKPDPSQLPTGKLLEYVAANLPADLNRKIAPSNPQLINILRLSGLLYERLFNEPNSKDTQQILYYLARCERSLAPYYWYSINEVYLKECIVQFPKQAYSRKCYDAYEAGMKERYFGGPMPEGVRQSVEALKEYL